MNNTLLALLSLLLLAGCASSPSTLPPRADRNLPSPPDTLPTLPEPEGVLTLSAVVEHATRTSPALAVYSWEVRAREARIRQAGTTPNPTLALAVEDIVGTSIYRGVDQAQTTLQYGQTLELGGKRTARISAAEAGRDLVLAEYAVARRTIAIEATGRYVDLLIAQERERSAVQGVDVATRLVEVVAERVRSGKVSATEETKAGIILTTQQLELDNARAVREAARQRLAAVWGSMNPRFTAVAGSVDSLLSLPPLDSLTAFLNQHPEVERSHAEIALRRAQTEVERARRTPDLTISGGVRRYETTGDFGAVLGLSMPLPLFDNNEGAVAEAEAQVAGLQQEECVRAFRRRAELADRYRVTERASIEARSVRDRLLPDAQAAFEAVREGYLLGRFGLVDVLDAERTLLQTRSRYLDALVAYQRARSELRALLGETAIPINTDFQR